MCAASSGKHARGLAILGATPHTKDALTGLFLEEALWGLAPVHAVHGQEATGHMAHTFILPLPYL